MIKIFIKVAYGNSWDTYELSVPVFRSFRGVIDVCPTTDHSIVIGTYFHHEDIVY